MKVHHSHHSRHSEQMIPYMEVYGVNRVIYRVTACNTYQKKAIHVTYGVSLQNLRTGETAEITAFSNNLEKTICFVNDLIQREAQPYQIYNAAFRQLSLEVPFMRKGSILGCK